MEFFRYHNTNCFFIKSTINEKVLAIDAGWPYTFYEYARTIKTIGYGINQIAWAIVTHFHMDHAGLISEFLSKGIKCFVFENQIDTIDQMEKTILKNYKKYVRIKKDQLTYVKTIESRKILREMGISGEVIITPEHSPDSISFISDSKEAVIGDLPPINQFMPDDTNCLMSWDLIKQKGVKTVYPSHAEIFDLQEIPLTVAST
jgi:ribonuclease/clavin/mitogillin